ncbi:unnamed protein product, partial [Rotaria sp. Silwood1]
MRWLRLLPSVQRLVENYEPLKQYFQNSSSSTEKSITT